MRIIPLRALGIKISHSLIKSDKECNQKYTLCTWLTNKKIYIRARGIPSGSKDVSPRRQIKQNRKSRKIFY
jgi:hypothetical protein